VNFSFSRAQAGSLPVTLTPVGKQAGYAQKSSKLTECYHRTPDFSMVMNNIRIVVSNKKAGCQIIRENETPRVLLTRFDRGGRLRMLQIISKILSSHKTIVKKPHNS
jgi:hypothetical protein